MWHAEKTFQCAWTTQQSNFYICSLLINKYGNLIRHKIPTNWQIACRWTVSKACHPGSFSWTLTGSMEIRSSLRREKTDSITITTLADQEVCENRVPRVYQGSNILRIVEAGCKCIRLFTVLIHRAS